MSLSEPTSSFRKTLAMSVFRSIDCNSFSFDFDGSFVVVTDDSVASNYELHSALYHFPLGKSKLFVLYLSLYL